METAISQSKRKMWVVVNYAGLVVLLASFYSEEQLGFSAPLFGAAIFAVLTIMVSFIQAYGRTGLWRFVHTGVEKLDEREMKVTYESLRHSYAWFTVVCLLLLLGSELWFNLLDHYRVSLMPVIAALIYLAHILPASVIAWTEREIYRD